MDESSDSHFFRPSTWIWSRPDRCLWRIKVGDDFLTNFGVTEISIEKFQISYGRKSMYRDTCVIKIWVLWKVTSTKFVITRWNFEIILRLGVQNKLIPLAHSALKLKLRVHNKFRKVWKQLLYFPKIISK